ncbi:MAG: conjugal transfer protein TraR [Ignavibacteria bacterium]|jgi:RNA polymerase-binding transcription factor DksA
MAKKKTSTKTGTKKSTTKSSTKKKSTVTKKKSASKKKVTKKAAVKKKSTRKAAPKKKSTTKRATPKKAAKATAKKNTTRKKSTGKKTVVKKKAAVKKTSAPKTRKKVVKKEVAKKPAISRAEALKKIKGYGKKDLEDFRTIIIEKRDEILEDLQSLKEQMLDPTTGEYINENSPYSLHMAEQGTDAMEREKTFLYAQRENKFLAYLDDALKRIDSGIYGICTECIEEPQRLCETCPLVPKERLIAVPHTQLCLPMKERKGGR